jgi:RNA polymerase sigma-70 factor (ECF subfamily)
MCRSFPNVKDCTETLDVLQSSLMRFLHTLQQIDPLPATTRDFFNLAAVHIRRELLDLARHFKNKRWLPLTVSDSCSTGNHNEPAAPTAADFEKWEHFHEAVAALPVEECEVVGLVFYHGWKQDEIATLLQVSERTVRRRWKDACERLRERASELVR